MQTDNNNKYFIYFLNFFGFLLKMLSSKEETKIYNEQVAKIHGQIIKLNVGGTRFYASYGILRTSPYLKQVLNDIHSFQDEVFIDRSGQLFIHIIQYLRDGRINATDRLEALLVEAKFYGLSSLVQTLEDWIKDPISDRNKEYQLIEMSDLSTLSKLTPEMSTTKAICDTHDLITVVSYTPLVWHCSVHGSIDRCPTVNCTGSITSQWATSPCQKLLVRKK